MIIIPIGHESTTVRRQPWVTYGIMLLCVAVFLATGATREDAEVDFDALEQAVEHYVEHPYLDVDSRLDAFLRAFDDPAWRELATSSHLEDPDPAMRAAHQEKLDELTQRAFAHVDAHPLKRYGVVTSDLRPGAYLTHMFLHAGWLHLLGNLFLLFLIGTCIEDVWGRPLYAAFYLLAGVAAAIVFTVRHPGLDTPMVGASGAIAGAMGAFLIRYWKSRIRFFWAWGIWWHGTFMAPAFLMLPLWLGKELLWATLNDAIHAGGAGGVAHWAHVGGFAFGAAAALGMRALRIEKRFIHHKIEAKITSTGNPAVEDAMAARAEGRDGDAFELLSRAARRTPDDADVAVALFDTAAAMGRARETAPALLRVVRNHVRRGEAEGAVEHWLELARQVPDPPAEPTLLVRLAPLLRDAGHAAPAAHALRAAISQDAPPPGLARRVADLARDLDPAVALQAAQAALASPELDPAGREKLEQLVADVEPRALAQLAGEQAGPAPHDARAIELPPEPGDPALDLAGGRGGADRPAERGAGPDLTDFGAELDSAGPTMPLEPDAGAAGGVAAALAGAAAGAPARAVDGDADPPVSGIEEMLDFEARSLSEEDDLPAPAAAARPPPPRASGAPRLRVVEARPLDLQQDRLLLEIEGRDPLPLLLDRIGAVAVAAVRGLGRRPVIVIDLILRGGSTGGPLRIFRLHSNRFDPRRLVAEPSDPLGAMRCALDLVLERSGARPLPGADAARGRPFTTCESLEAYERSVLGAATDRS